VMMNGDTCHVMLFFLLPPSLVRLRTRLLALHLLCSHQLLLIHLAAINAVGLELTSIMFREPGSNPLGMLQKLVGAVHDACRLSVSSWPCPRTSDPMFPMILLIKPFPSIPRITTPQNMTYLVIRQCLGGKVVGARVEASFH
jgi:hypothetical protein